MRKTFVSIGLAVAGTASLQAVHAADVSGLNELQASKMWSVSGTLRGFYDDNYNATPTKNGSFGFEVSPSVNLNVPLQQTTIGLKYTYGLYYYENRDHLGQNPIDQTHNVDLWLDHAFNERWQTKVEDNFVSAQDPALLTGGGATQRSEGNNIVNTGSAKLDTDWTTLLSTELGYKNTFVDYSASGTGSYSATLDRDQNLIWLNLLWKLQQDMTAFVGYQFGQVNYTADEPLFTGGPTSSYRDYRSHYGYVGLQYNVLANLSVLGKVGVQYSDFYNSDYTVTSPYVDISATYTYAKGSYAQIGFTQNQASTDVAGLAGGVTQNQSVSTLYGSINHQITPKLIASLVGSWAYSAFNGGTYNNESENDYGLGVNLSYSFNQFISADVGYNYDRLDSDIGGRSYSRNRGYIGVTATY